MTCKKAEARQGKIYVGKLPPGEALSKEDIQTHFATFGEVSTIIFLEFYNVDKYGICQNFSSLLHGGHADPRLHVLRLKL